jgi:hypothetical protein
MADYPPPSSSRLFQRLRDFGCEIKAETAEEAEYHIHSLLCSEAVCCRCLVEGKPKLLRFREMWCAVYGRKWAWAKKESAA